MALRALPDIKKPKGCRLTLHEAVIPEDGAERVLGVGRWSRCGNHEYVCGSEARFDLILPRFAFGRGGRGAWSGRTERKGDE